MIPTSVYILLSLESLLFCFAIGMWVVHSYKEVQRKKMWAKVVRRVPFTLITNYTIGYVVPMETNVEGRFNLLDRK